jgi:hypothetical protein
MARGAAIAASIPAVVAFAGGALPLSVIFAVGLVHLDEPVEPAGAASKT